MPALIQLSGAIYLVWIWGESLEILLVNDDGYDSELLRSAAVVLQRWGRLTIVVPAEEQSWKGKSMTRFGKMQVGRVDLAGQQAWTVTGTPADCTNFAIHNICAQRPDVVVSGVNIGTNTGVCFIFSSGTVGACFEANIAGVPALALSQSVEWPVFEYYRDHRMLPPEIGARVLPQLEAYLEKTFKLFFSSSGLLEKSLTWNINFPFVSAPGNPLQRARVGWDRYGRAIFKDGDYCYHKLSSVEHEKGGDVEEAFLARGIASVTLLDMGGLGRNSGVEVERLDQELPPVKL